MYRLPASEGGVSLLHNAVECNLTHSNHWRSTYELFDDGTWQHHLHTALVFYTGYVSHCSKSPRLSNDSTSLGTLPREMKCYGRAKSPKATIVGDILRHIIAGLAL